MSAPLVSILIPTHERPAYLREALLSQGAKGQRLGTTLVALGLLTENELAEALAEAAE